MTQIFIRNRVISYQGGFIGGGMAAGGGPPVFDAVSDASGTTTITKAHTTGSGSNRYMLVAVAWNASNSARDISSVTYNSVGLTLISGSKANDPTTLGHTALYGLVNPSTGNNNIVVTFDGVIDGAVVGITTWSNVNQSTPVGPAATASANGITSSLDVSSATGEIALDVVRWGNFSATADASQTQRWNNVDLTSTISSAGSTKAGTTTTHFAWTFELARDYAASGVSIKGL